MKNTRNYPMGYLPKIAYHTANGNTKSATYFISRQVARYGEMTAEQLAFVNAEAARIAGYLQYAARIDGLAY